ncbi:MAG: efflux RND transporter periplasmic adaptor subunit [Desulfocurvibacter africanus]
MAKSLLALLTLLALLVPTASLAQQERPPAKVVIAQAAMGSVTPQTAYIGTVYFNEVAQVATEVAGIVDSYDMEEGGLVERGQILVRLNTDLLRMDLTAKQAAHQQALSDLALAEADYRRMSSLFASGSVSEQEYDQKRFNYQSQQKRAAELEASVDQIKLKLGKSQVRAPFSGTVLDRLVARGDWLDTGAAVASLARDDAVDVVVNVSQDIAALARPGAEVDIRVADLQRRGQVQALIPKGDVATRTFPLKIRVRDARGLAEGMEARVILPSGPMVEALLVPRDAVISVFGQLAVWTVADGKALMVPVQVVGYQGGHAGVRPQGNPGLAPGMPVVVKGNERLRAGQPVSPEPAR